MHTLGFARTRIAGLLVFHDANSVFCVLPYSNLTQKSLLINREELSCQFNIRHSIGTILLLGFSKTVVAPVSDP